MPDFQKLIARLQKHHGIPALPPARNAFEFVIWENACYLLPDERRAQVFEGLRAQVGLSPEAIDAAPGEVLLALAKLGGMRPEERVLRWREIAGITLSEFGGDLEQVVRWPFARAKKALKKFPSIGDPGAEKILLFCGIAQGLPVESNGLRVLTRVGYGRAGLKNYGVVYRSVQESVGAQLPASAATLVNAHLLLREHGKTICRDRTPECHLCPVEWMCAFRASAS